MVHDSRRRKTVDREGDGVFGTSTISIGLSRQPWRREALISMLLLASLLWRLGKFRGRQEAVVSHRSASKQIR